MGFSVLPVSHVRSVRPVKVLKCLPIPRGLSAKKGTGRMTVQRHSNAKIKAKEGDLDWSEKSREVFETAMDKGTKYAKSALDAWESAGDEKPALIAIGIVVLTMLYATNATLTAMEHVPLVGITLKVIGLYVTGWFIYRVVSSDTDRNEVVKTVDNLTKRITGE